MARASSFFGRDEADVNDRTALQRFLSDDRRSPLERYRELVVGDRGLGALVAYESVTGLLGGLPGLPGLWLRRQAYRTILARQGRGAVIGRHVVLRQPARIELGDAVVLDDGVVLDVKGLGERGIALGNGTILGRNTIVSAKSAWIRLGEAANVGSTCRIATTAGLEIGRGVLVAAYAYLGGGNHGWRDTTVPVIGQEMEPSEGLRIGDFAWIGAGAIVLDGAHVGEHAIVGAGAVVTKPVPPYAVAAGVPAKVVMDRREEGSRP